MRTKTKAKTVLGLVVLAGVAAVATAAFVDLRHKKRAGSQAVDNIQSELDNLDPVTRAAVVAKVGKDEVRHPGGSTA